MTCLGSRFPESRRAWRRLKFAWADHWAARNGCVLIRNPFSEMNGCVLFSVRDKISKAIADPGLYFERLRSSDNMIETLDHWQARAAIEAMMQCAASSPSFALAIEARKGGNEVPSRSDESATRQGNAR